jgi:hypothetical protein
MGLEEKVTDYAEDDLRDPVTWTPDITHTTMGHPILPDEEGKVRGMEPAKGAWQKWHKKWVPNFGYKGRRRRSL